MKFTNFLKGDATIWAVFFLLSGISIVEIFSSASQLSYKTGDFYYPLIRQCQFVAAGFALILMISRIPCRFFKIVPILLLPASWFLLLFAMFFVKATNDGARWIPLGAFSFQPSELAKFGLIIYTALILSALQRENGVAPQAFKYIMIPTVITCGLIFFENFSTAALLFGVILLMMFVGRIPLKRFGQLAAVGVGGIMFLLVLVKVLPKGFVDEISLLHRADTWVSRLDKFSEESSDDPKDFNLQENSQVGTANIAIATSNIIGLAPGNSVQRDFLSQAFSDFIFAIIIEEMGIEGAFAVILLYIILVFRAWKIAAKCKANFPAFLVLGLAFMLACQAVINMMVAVGLFPCTGQPLPLISRGGTAFLIFSCYFGMMLSISISAKRVDEENLANA
jgi:cell division protein FtsW